MVPGRIWALTVATMISFSANQLLCRLALKQTHLDAGTFTLVRLVSGALMLLLLMTMRGSRRMAGDWPSALVLLGYAVFFSFAYLSLSAGTGALLLFGAVQTTMIVRGFVRGERLSAAQSVGAAIALLGLVILVLPGVQAPPAASAVMMATAGVFWGVYSLRGHRSSDPVAETTGNFVRAAAIAVVVSLAFLSQLRPHGLGVLYAVLSGAGASGLGYSLWYGALRGLTSVQAAIVQLSVPIITALVSVPLLGERITTRLVFCSVMVLGGIAVFVLTRHPRPSEVARTQ